MPETTQKRQTIRNQVMTIFGDPPEWDSLREYIRYFAYAKETCPTTGREHLQGFAQAWKPMRATKWRELFPNIRMEVMRGTLRSNDAYCSKQGRLIEFGEKPEENGQKTTLLRYKRKIEEGEQVNEIAEEDAMFPTYLQYRNGLHEYEHHIKGKRVCVDRNKPKVYIRIGDSGSGKTKWLDEQFGLNNWARMPNPSSGTWWITKRVSFSDNVLIDDVGPSKIPKIEEFLEWTDRYPIEFNSKGGHLWWKPKTITITSNLMPSDWWPDMTDAHKEAVMRRVFQITAVYKDKPEEVVYENAEEVLPVPIETPQHPDSPV